MDKFTDRRPYALVKARRQKVAGFVNNKLSKREMDAIEKKNQEKANALSKEAFRGKGFIPLPMASFGMPEFDAGERFDLRGPYADEGWVDENDAGGFKNPFAGLFGKMEKPPPPPPKKKGFFGRGK